MSRLSLGNMHAKLEVDSFERIGLHWGSTICAHTHRHSVTQCLILYYTTTTWLVDRATFRPSDFRSSSHQWLISIDSRLGCYHVTTLGKLFTLVIYSKNRVPGPGSKIHYPVPNPGNWYTDFTHITD